MQVTSNAAMEMRSKEDYAKEVVRVSNFARHKRGSNFGRFPFRREPRDQTLKRGCGSRSFIVATRLDFADAWKTTIITTVFASGGVDEADIAYPTSHRCFKE